MSARIINNGTAPATGQKYSLTCNISRAENLDPTVTYRWIKNNGTQTHYVVGTNSPMSILSFRSLRLSDAGKYICEVTVNSHLFHNPMNASSEQLEVHISGKPINFLL